MRKNREGNGVARARIRGEKRARRWSMHGAGGTDMRVGKRKQVGG